MTTQTENGASVNLKKKTQETSITQIFINANKLACGTKLLNDNQYTTKKLEKEVVWLPDKGTTNNKKLITIRKTEETVKFNTKKLTTAYNEFKPREVAYKAPATTSSNVINSITKKKDSKFQQAGATKNTHSNTAIKNDHSSGKNRCTTFPKKSNDNTIKEKKK